MQSQQDAESKPPLAVLEIASGGFSGTRYELSMRETVIGRNPNTEITLLDDGVSREHAMVCYDPGAEAYVVEDLESSNGTHVNGKAVRAATLEPGDEIRVGRTVFRFWVIPPDAH